MIKDKDSCTLPTVHSILTYFLSFLRGEEKRGGQADDRASSSFDWRYRYYLSMRLET